MQTIYHLKPKEVIAHTYTNRKRLCVHTGYYRNIITGNAVHIRCRKRIDTQINCLQKRITFPFLPGQLRRHIAYWSKCLHCHDIKAWEILRCHTQGFKTKMSSCDVVTVYNSISYLNLRDFDYNSPLHDKRESCNVEKTKTHVCLLFYNWDVKKNRNPILWV